MFGVGFSEIIVITVIGLIFVGPKKLPELAKQAGKAFVKFRRITTDVRSTVDDFIRQAEDEVRREEREAILKVLGANESQPDVAQIPEHNPHHDPHHQHDPHHDQHHPPHVDTTHTTVDVTPHQPAQDETKPLAPPGSGGVT